MYQPLSLDERLRRAELIESFLREGYGPLRLLVGKGSATEKADKADGKVSGTYARWIRDEERRRKTGRMYVLPNWSLYSGDAPDFTPPQTSDVAWVKPIPEVVIEEVPEDLDARARHLRAEIVTLVTSSDYPVNNTSAIVVDTTMKRRFNKRTGEYERKASTPRTWLSETLTVEPVLNAAGRRFIFTAAQNDGQLHEAFWQNLQAFALHVGAEIVVGPLTYETSWWSETNTAARDYPVELHPHLCFGQLAVGDDFVFAGEMNTIVTASQPVSDLMTYSRNRWAVFPHAKRQLKSVPSTDPNEQAHQVMTTGMVTKPKIIPRKAGIKSLFHQVIGAVLVEFDERSRVFCRQLTANEDGSFYDLDRRVAGGVVTTGHRAAALVAGDVHLRKLDPLNSLATFGFAPGHTVRNKGSLLDTLNPHHVVLHDIFDNETRNHHHLGDSAYSYELAIRGRDSVSEEIGDVGDFLLSLHSPDRKTIVVESNHDIGLERWVREGRYRNDGANTMLGLRLETAYMRHREAVAQALDLALPTPRFSLLQHALLTTYIGSAEEVEWAYDGTSRLLDGIEIGHHGFRGTNGSKGTVQGFMRTGRKMTIADKHSPEIAEGCYVAGCMNLHQGYNKGPSSWAVAHVVHYPDGQRAIITLQDGRFRADKPRLSVASA
jgi:hypothetical protein